MELIKPGLWQRGNSSKDKASWLQQQLHSPLGNITQTFCLSICTEIQKDAQSDAFITIKINMLFFKATMSLLHDGRSAASFHRCIWGQGIDHQLINQDVYRQQLDRAIRNLPSERGLRRVITQFSTYTNTTKRVKGSNFAGSYKSILLTQYSMWKCTKPKNGLRACQGKDYFKHKYRKIWPQTN